MGNNQESSLTELKTQYKEALFTANQSKFIVIDTKEALKNCIALKERAEQNLFNDTQKVRELENKIYSILED